MSKFIETDPATFIKFPQQQPGNSAGDLEARNALARAIRPAVENYSRDREHYGMGWDEAKHKRGQPGNAGQFGPGGSSGKAPEAKSSGKAPAAKAPSPPAAKAPPTGSVAPHGTSSADYHPTKAVKPDPNKGVRAADLLKSLGEGKSPEEAMSENLAHKSPAVQAVEKDYPPANQAGQDTEQRHMNKDGTFTPQRAALHQKIIGKILNHIPVSKDKTFTMMGGGPAAGKSSIMGTGQVDIPQSAHVDADAIKDELPEYRALIDAKDMRAASYAHEESSGIGKTVMAQGLANGQNVMLDGTGNASLDGVEKKVKQARDAGYKVHAEYVTCPTEVAWQRNVERAKKKGRLPPEGMVRATHKNVSKILPAAIAKGLFDHVRLWDTHNKDANGNPVLVATGEGTKLTVHHPELWQTFLAKGNE